MRTLGEKIGAAFDTACDIIEVVFFVPFAILPFVAIAGLLYKAIYG